MMLMFYVLDFGFYKYGMDEFFEFFFEYKFIFFFELVGRGKNKKMFDQIFILQVVKYVVEDVDVMGWFYCIFKLCFVKEYCLFVYEMLEWFLVFIFCDMEDVGIKVDLDMLCNLFKDFVKCMIKYEKVVYM